MSKKSIFYIILGIAIPSLILVYIILNLDQIKPLVVEVKTAFSIIELIKKETGLQKVSFNIEVDPNKGTKGLVIEINDDYKGDLKKMAEKVQLLTFDNYTKKLDYVEVVYKKPGSGITVKVDERYVFGKNIKSFRLTKEQLKELRKIKQP